jgi:hypothetical protein
MVNPADEVAWFPGSWNTARVLVIDRAHRGEVAPHHPAADPEGLPG